MINVGGRNTNKEVKVLSSVGVNVESYLIQAPEVDDTARINRAVADAGVTGRVIIPPRTYNISGKITFNCHVMASGAVFNVTANLPIAVEVREGTGTTIYQGKTAYLPDVVKQTKTWDGTDIGVQVTNVNQSNVYFGKVSKFSTGIVVAGSGTGNSYNNYFLTNTVDNKVNLQLLPLDSSAWVNENNFYGGAYAHLSGSGTNVSGARHILISSASHTPNNNVFYKPSIEGDTPEFHIECWGSYNHFIAPRFEASPPKVAFRAIDASNFASDNVIFYGYNASSVVITEDTNTKWNVIYMTKKGSRFVGSTTGGVYTGSNTSGGSVFTALEATANLNTDPSTQYAVTIGPTFSKYKRAVDTLPRMEIDHTVGKISWGDGASAYDNNLYRYGAIGLKTDKKFLAVNGLGVGNSAAATTAGSIVKKMEVFDATGASLGFIPIYSTIT